MKLVGEEIRKRRKQLRLTQSEVAGKTMSVSKLSNIENGKMLPDPATWTYLRQRLGLSRDLSKQKQTAEQVQFLFEQAGTYETAQLYERAEVKYRESGELAEQSLLLDEAGRSYHKLAGLEIKRRKYKAALEHLKKALACFART
ncbi:MAG TPA: helix-turn-helix transcriptional regulator, partial [Bacillales bacterium]|nr:helix-turn-helix transcriptional regulator [Bacillales bacterium]